MEVGTKSGPMEESTGLAIGNGFSCALLSTGRVKCWGNNLAGQLGGGRGRMNNPVPVTVPKVRRAIEVTASPGVASEFACALVRSGSVMCWGFNTNGQLGLNRSRVTSPVKVKGIRNARSVSAGEEFVCAALKTGRVKCWGDNYYWQLGIGRKEAPEGLVRNWGGSVGEPFPQPVRVDGVSKATSVTSGMAHACALVRGGRIMCWGNNQRGETGKWSYFPSVRPHYVPGVMSATSVRAAYGYTCAVLSNGSVSCWGDNEGWKFGHPDEPRITPPVPVPGVIGVSSIAASDDGGGPDAGCGVLIDGSLTCWGGAAFDVVPSGAPREPRIVVSGPGVSAVEMGSSHTCVIQSGIVKCWGSNSYGQLGTKGRYSKWFQTPVPVMGL